MSKATIPWTELKVALAAKDTFLDYVEDDTVYIIWLHDGVTTYETTIWKDTTQLPGLDVAQNNIDKADWEANFKSDARRARITKTIIGDRHGLDVNVINASELSSSELSVEGKIFATATPTLTLSPAGTEHPVFLLKNPVSSGKLLRIRNIIVSLIPSAAQKKPTTFRVYTKATITADGTALSAANKRSSAILAAVGTPFYEPTISANGDVVKAVVVEGASFPLEEDFTEIIDQGDNLLITANNIINNTDIHVSVDWAEIEDTP